MNPTRRSILRLGGGCVGAALMAGCGSGEDAADPSSPPDTAPPPVTPPAPTSPVVAALKRHFADHAVAHLALPPLASAAPEVSWAGPVARYSSTTSPATTLTDGLVVPANSELVGRPAPDKWIWNMPGNPAVNGFPCLRINRNYTSRGVERENSAPRVYRLRTDAPVFEIAGVAADNVVLVQTMIVDGQLVRPTVLAAGLGQGGGYVTAAIRVDFGSRATRDIWIETALFAAYFKFGAGDLVLPPLGDSEPQITFVGDSYLQTSSTIFGNGMAIGLEVGARLGIGRVLSDVVGGTGYLTSRGLGNLNDRLPSHAADSSQMYVVMAGINDFADFENNQLIWPSQAEYENAVIGYFSNLRAARPDAVIVATAPFCPIPPMSDSSYVGNSLANPTGLGDNLYKASVQKRAIQSITGPWVYIDVLMGGGWLNSSGRSGDVTNLQWFTGGLAGPGTTANYRPGNTLGGGGGGYGGIESIPVLVGGRYSQAPEVRVHGGSGHGLLLTSTINANGALTSIIVVCAGDGYLEGGGMPVVEIDTAWQISPAQLGAPKLMVGIRPDGEYPLAAFAPAGATDLNNIYRLISLDTVHPSHLGVEYLSARLARNIHDAIMAL